MSILSHDLKEQIVSQNFMHFVGLEIYATVNQGKQWQIQECLKKLRLVKKVKRKNKINCFIKYSWNNRSDFESSSTFMSKSASLHHPEVNILIQGKQIRVTFSSCSLALRGQVFCSIAKIWQFQFLSHSVAHSRIKQGIIEYTIRDYERLNLY